MSLSSITISGTLTKDPEKRFTPTNIPVANLMIEICYFTRGSQNQAKRLSSQVVRVNAWRDLAEECEKNLKKGDKVLVIGRAQINAYTSSDGRKKREIEIDANSISFLKDVINVFPPPKEKEQETTRGKQEEKIEISSSEFKKSAHDIEEITNVEEIINSTEEIPF